LRSRFISEPLALDADQSAFGALNVVDSEFDAVAIAEVVFREIAWGVGPMEF